MKWTSVVLAILLSVSFINAQSNGAPQPAPEPTPIDPPVDPIYGYVQLGLSIAAIIFGLLWVFFGYRLIKFVLFMAGFVLFFFIAFQLQSAYAPFASEGRLWLQYTLSAVAAIVGGFLFVVLRKLGYFLFGMVLGMALGLLILSATPLGSLINSSNFGSVSPSLVSLLSVLGVGLIVGIVTVIFSRVILIIGTSFNGAYLVGSTVDGMWLHTSLSDILSNILNMSSTGFAFDISNWIPYALLGGIVALAIIGMIVQFLVTARNYDPEASGEVEHDGGYRSLPMEHRSVPMEHMNV